MMQTLCPGEVCNMTQANINITDITVTTSDQDRDIRIQFLNAAFFDKVWPAFIIWGLIATIGVIGNVSIFLMLWLGKNVRQKPLRRHIMSLASVDLGGCLVLVPMEIYRYNNNFSDGMEPFYKAKCTLNVLYMTCSCFILVSIAIDRYRALAYPLSVRQSTDNRSLGTICRRALYVLSVPVLCVPPVFLCGASPTVRQDERGDNITVYVNGGDQRYVGTPWYSVYKLSAVIIHSFLSCVLIVMYVKIAIVVRKKNRMTKNASIRYTDSGKLDESGHPRRVPTNIKIYFIVTAVFISCYFTYIGLTFVRSDKLPGGLLLVYTVFFKLYYVHSIIMPILYFKMDKKLRQYFLSIIFCNNRPRKPSNAFSISSMSS